MSKYIFGVVCFLFSIGFSLIEAQGYCAKYTCEQNKDFSSSFILKCNSDGPEFRNDQSSNFDCSNDLNLLELKLEVTICSQTAPSYSMNVLPDTTVSREYQRLTRYLQVIAGRQTTTNSRCYYRNILISDSQTTKAPFIGDTTVRPVMTYHISRSVLIGSVIGAFFGGVLVAAIIFVSIYFCCLNRKKEDKRRFVTPRINEAYRRDPNDNFDTPTDLRQKDWNQEHRGRMDRINGVIHAFTLENVVDTYASIGTINRNNEVDLDNETASTPTPPKQSAEEISAKTASRPTLPKPSAEEISAMYSKIDRAKKRRAPNGKTSAGDSNMVLSSDPSYTSSKDIYITGRNGSTEPSESVAGSAEIVQPANSLHLYHILEKPEPSSNI